MVNAGNSATPYMAVMQGRMVPPEGGNARYFPMARWREEFSLAAQAGLSGIEWIYDLYGENINPLSTDSGIDEMKQLSDKSGVVVRSLCANYCMDRPCLRTAPTEISAWLPRMEWLLARCKTAGIQRVVVPLLDECAIHTEQEALQTAEMLHAFLPAAEKCGVELHLETSLAPKDFSALLAECLHPLVRVTYDCGNSAANGYSVAEEFTAYGARIGSVHVKDRKRNCGSVPLGEGDADLTEVFRALAAIQFQGDYVLEIARPKTIGELPWMIHNRNFIAHQIETCNLARLV